MLDSAADLNALRVAMADELHRLAVELEEDASLRAIVLTHEGDFFGAGADLTALEGDKRDPASGRRLAGSRHEAIRQSHQAEVPALGAIHCVAASA